MRTVPGCALVAVLCLSAGLMAEDKKDEKIDAKKLVGKWEPKDKPDGVTATVEFSKDGKATLTVKSNDKETKSEGDYKIDGNKLTVTMKLGDQEQKMIRTVTKLTETELVTTDEKGTERTFVRTKAK